MTDISDLRSTIVPRSDQLNSEQLLAGPITITVTDVRIGSAEQPISVHYEGESGRPYKPCKTMRKVLIFAWGQDGNDWPGKSMTLYCDPTVKFGGDEVGGIRISHISDIERDLQVSLTATRGKKVLHTIKKLVVKRGPSIEDITNSPTIEALKDNFGAAYKATKDTGLRAKLKAAYDERLAVLQKPVMTYAQLAEQINGAADEAVAGLILDDAASILPPDQHAELTNVFNKKWTPQ